MENVINEMAENLKGFLANIEAKLEETKAEIKVVRDEAQKQFDAQAAATKKAAKREVKHLDDKVSGDSTSNVFEDDEIEIELTEPEEQANPMRRDLNAEGGSYTDDDAMAI